jgi:altronate dehydratase small subunit
MNNAILIDPRDNVAVVLEPVSKNAVLSFGLGGETKILTAGEDIPVYHKIARTDIPRGAAVLKYGEEIGVAFRDIQAGEHVHVHNLRSRGRSGRPCRRADQQPDRRPDRRENGE